MINAGRKHTLTVNRISDFGLYLADEQGNEVLLPNRYVSMKDKVGDTKEVFVYHDSEDRLVATTETPFAKVGDIAVLEVVDKTSHGAFLDWGLFGKDLFLPNRNQQGLVEVGGKVLVYLYEDHITGRTVATSKLQSVVSNMDIRVRPGQRVEVLVAKRVDVGFRVVVEGRHWGMIYHNQLFRPVAVGDRLTAYVRHITEDGRIDLSLQQQGYDEVKHSATKLLEMLERAGGVLPINDHSAPEEITTITHMSKKVFKRSLGVLMKSGDVIETETGIKLIRR